jgi:flavin reductase (DIM6/NTAB) family NADH-FMN oxidoreductase RutF
MISMNIHLTYDDILNMENRKRAAFMNSLSGFKSASLIGTTDNLNNSNLAIFSSVIHLGSNPALVGFINRPDTVERHTFENIIATNCFTINQINKSIYKQAHQTLARYPKDVSEFESTGLTAEYINDFKAPFVKESVIKYGLEFIEKHELKINGTILVIGKVIEVILPESCLLTDGAINIEMAETITISGLDTYHATHKIARLSYAKPDITSIEIS